MNIYTEQETIKNNLSVLQERVLKIVNSIGIDKQGVQILLATKTVTVERIQAAIELGYFLVGENKVQELVKKMPTLSQWIEGHNQKKTTNLLKLESHFIGHLQSNKIKEAVTYADYIQSIDRLSLIEKLDLHCKKISKIQNILIQVNVSGEMTKFGISPNELFLFLETVKKNNYSNINIKGLMTLGLNSSNEKEVRKGFAHLKQLHEKAISLELIPIHADVLSMGMSHDLEWAIAEGANLIRVGSAVFGAR